MKRQGKDGPKGAENRHAPSHIRITAAGPQEHLVIADEIAVAKDRRAETRPRKGPVTVFNLPECREHGRQSATTAATTTTARRRLRRAACNGQLRFRIVGIIAKDGNR